MGAPLQLKTDYFLRATLVVALKIYALLDEPRHFILALIISFMASMAGSNTFLGSMASGVSLRNFLTTAIKVILRSVSVLTLLIPYLTLSSSVSKGTPFAPLISAPY